MSKHQTVNSYLAMFLIALAGAAAALIIVKLSYRNQYVIVNGSSEAGYRSLQNSILNSNAAGVPQGP